jgi:murein L,D-transpeptidase YcbB/YkuD
VIKFDLPSPFGVYLHDTPAKTLFARSPRAFSHGCMRLEKPQALAETLLAPQGWTSEAVAAAIATGATQSVALRRPLPLYVLYFTVTATADGAVQFRPDVYGWDRKLSAALAGAPAQAASTPPPTECSGGRAN